MSPAQKLLGQILVEMGFVDERKVNEALEYQKRAKPGTKIGTAMIELGFCDEVQVTKGLCRQYRLPFVDLSRSKIAPAPSTRASGPSHKSQVTGSKGGSSRTKMP